MRYFEGFYFKLLKIEFFNRILNNPEVKIMFEIVQCCRHKIIVQFRSLKSIFYLKQID